MTTTDSDQPAESSGGFMVPLHYAPFRGMTEEHLAWLEQQMANLPPLPWHRRARSAIRRRVTGAREAIALKIAPWLERDPYP